MTDTQNHAPDKLIFEAAVDHVPHTYLKVWRWASAGEVELWERSSGRIPQGLREHEDLAVTTPDAEKPPGTGWFRLEFWIDCSALKSTSRPQWLQVRAPIAGTPILGLRIYFNEGLVLLRRLSNQK